MGGSLAQMSVRGGTELLYYSLYQKSMYDIMWYLCVYCTTISNNAHHTCNAFQDLVVIFISLWLT
jgi:hypothetical protein